MRVTLSKPSAINTSQSSSNKVFLLTYKRFGIMLRTQEKEKSGMFGDFCVECFVCDGLHSTAYDQSTIHVSCR